MIDTNYYYPFFLKTDSEPMTMARVIISKYRYSKESYRDKKPVTDDNHTKSPFLCDIQWRDQIVRLMAYNTPTRDSFIAPQLNK